MRLYALDTTLRDGAQSGGMSLRAQDKIRVMRVLDRLGIDYIEAGMPAGSETDARFYELVKEEAPLQNAVLCAFSATCHPNCQPESDENLRACAASPAPVVSVFGKASEWQVKNVLQTTPEENLRMIAASVRYLAESGKRVFFDAEHFFDGARENKEYSFKCLRAAADGGAEILTLCDTNGGTLFDYAAELTGRVCAEFPGMVSIHAHNDAGIAAAVSMAAVGAGAVQVQGTVGGMGERCGNADLCTLLPNLILKMGYNMQAERYLSELTRLSRTVSEICNFTQQSRAPYVGSSAFAHKGGTHIDAMLKNDRSFEHINPKAVGNSRRLLISDQSGRSAVLTRLAYAAPDIKRDSPEMDRVMTALKKKAAEGYRYETAEGSFELLALKALGRRKSFYEVLDFHVLCEKATDARNAMAHIKVKVGDSEEINAAEGDGPVNALDNALRKALSVFYPCLEKMRLSDFKVRVIDSGGTASTVRVQIETTDGERVWSTIGVSPNIISACFKALTDSIDYKLTFLNP